MKKKAPKLKTDKQAEAFLAQDLSGLDFSQFKPARFEFENKGEQINIRVPKRLLVAVKDGFSTKIRSGLNRSDTRPSPQSPPGR
jgi:predicted DNA binding CopG/RHH family protein